MTTSKPGTMRRFNVPDTILAKGSLLTSLLIYTALAVWFSLLPNYGTTPVLDIRDFAPGLPLGLLYGALVTALFCLYLLLYRLIYDGRWVLHLWQIVAISALLSLPLLVMYPINANDVFRYIVRGRISSVYGANPFMNAPDTFAGDKFVDFAGEWRTATSPYGPLWERLSSMLTTVSGDNLLLGLLLFKLLALLAVLATGVLLWHLLVKDQATSRQVALTVLWSWNPAILLTFVANGHNDALWIAVLLFGWFVLNRGYSGPAILLAVVAALFKPIALLAVPLMFVYAWRDTGSLRGRIELALWTVLGGTALVFLTFMPYGSPTVIVPRLLQEAEGGTSFAPFTLFLLIVRHFRASAPFSTITDILPVLFVGFYGWLVWMTWRTRSPEFTIPRAFYSYLVQALNFRIWYASWPFPWLLLDADSGSRRARQAMEAGIWFLLLSQLSVLIYGHFRVYVLNGDFLWAHIVGVTTVFLLPPLLPLFVSFTPEVKVSTPNT